MHQLGFPAGHGGVWAASQGSGGAGVPVEPGTPRLGRESQGCSLCAKPCSPIQGGASASALTGPEPLVFQVGQGSRKHLWEVPKPPVMLGVALDEQKERENVEP